MVFFSLPQVLRFEPDGVLRLARSVLRTQSVPLDGRGRRTPEAILSPGVRLALQTSQATELTRLMYIGLCNQPRIVWLWRQSALLFLQSQRSEKYRKLLLLPGNQRTSSLNSQVTFPEKKGEVQSVLLFGLREATRLALLGRLFNRRIPSKLKFRPELSATP